MTNFFASLRKPITKPALTVSQPIHHYTQDSLTYAEQKPNLYGELGHDTLDSPSHPSKPLPSDPISPQPYHLLLQIIYTSVALLSTASVALFSVAVPLWDQNFIHTGSPIHGDWNDAIVLAPLGISLLFSTYLVTTTILRRRRAKSPPDPFYVALMCVTVLITLPPWVVLAALNCLARAFQPSSDGTATGATAATAADCTLRTIMTRTCLPELYLIGELQIAGIVTASMVALAWLVIFVLMLKIYMQRRKAEKRREEERRKRRHARRKERERRAVKEGEHVHGSGALDKGTPQSRSGSRSERSRMNGHSGRSQPQSDRRGHESNAVRHTHGKVKPKETIQVWLADRYV